LTCPVVFRGDNPHGRGLGGVGVGVISGWWPAASGGRSVEPGGGAERVLWCRPSFPGGPAHAAGPPELIPCVRRMTTESERVGFVPWLIPVPRVGDVGDQLGGKLPCSDVKSIGK
jgi:hypothetical protein